ncbi:flagellar basal-body MS-ring/collar protein FliF [Sandarakinorhabdus sp. AAP62]|uniref:flagellar basal-body MS-ring/collar protein FliF n=1 Tax=Sandarakinorhabdus sp. AAP62 TaxID=1248916 RepID=UPI0002E9E7C5|nr:flagellar basal-body MS-ring/collar protein FliF [Sandarakinorhabdus sp. AAP62]
MSEAAAIPADPPPSGLAVPPALAPIAGRARSLWASPAVQQARPALLVIALLAVAALAWFTLRQPNWRPLYPGLAEADAAAVSDALAAANFEYRINQDSGTVEVPAGDAARARILLAGQGLPKASAAAGQALADMPLGASRSVEAARLKQALERELAASVEAIDGVKSARVHVATPEPSVFIRDRAAPSASVFVTLAPGRSLAEAQVRAVIWLVATSVPGLASDRVSVVDQSGALLSAGVSGDAQHLAYQQRLEGLVRERLVKLLTPMLGPGRFTAEVAADVDFSENEAASERFQPAGTVRSEQTSRNMDGTPPAAAGIPGALTNTVPQAAQVTGNPPAAPAPAAAGGTVTAETAARNYEIGKDVSVTRAGAPRLKRLSVAVVLDAAALGKDGAKELANIQRLVRGAMGFDAARGDLVEVQTRSFASETDAPAAWYETPVVKDYGLYIVAAAGVLILGLGAGFFLWRRRTVLAAAATATAEAASAALSRGGTPSAPSLFAEGTADKAAVEAMIDGGELLRPAAARDYSGKLDIARTLVTGDRDRAMAVARQMLLADLTAPTAPASAAAPPPDEEAEA